MTAPESVLSCRTDGCEKAVAVWFHTTTPRRGLRLTTGWLLTDIPQDAETYCRHHGEIYFRSVFDTFATRARADYRGEGGW